MYTVEHSKHRYMIFQMYSDLLDEFVTVYKRDPEKQFKDLITAFRLWLLEQHGIEFTDDYVHFASENDYLVFLMKYREE